MYLNVIEKVNSMKKQEKNFIILETLNHNALLCEGVITKNTYVFFGKGIGFKRKSGEKFVVDGNVQNALTVLTSEEASQYRDLVEMVENKKLIAAVQEVVSQANKFFGGHINANLNLTLLDHLNFALERKKRNIIINYPFLNELKFIYPKEYEFSERAFNYLNVKCGENVKFDEAELGFLVLHFHAAVTDSKVSKVLRNNEIIYDSKKIIEDSIREKIDLDSIYYSRFVKHLEYAIHRFKNGIKLENILLDSIKTKCSMDYEIAVKLNEMLKEKYKIDLDEDEIGYLAIHIYNLRNRKTNID